MQIIVKFSPEIMIKSRSVRILFIKILIKNIKILFKKNNILGIIIQHWDYLEIRCDCNYHNKICMCLIYIPGIHHVLIVKKSILCSFKDIYNQVILVHNDRLIGKSFCVRVKRVGKHDFTSQDVERYLGSKLCQNIKNTYVNLTKPDRMVYLEIKDNYLFIIVTRYEGLGGFPIGTQQELLSLISGGFDSAVASYMLIRRGCKVHYCFFNLEEGMHNFAVYRVAYHLWNKFGQSHGTKFISIDFSEVIKEIIYKIKNNQMGVVLKRMMIRAASLIAARCKISALITGEVLGQVSSQTLNNLKLINDVSNCIVLRPLISYDKEVIIDLARKIGTEIFSKNVPEYCAIVSNNPTVKAVKSVIELEENYFDFTILDRAVARACIINMQDISNKIIDDKNFIDFIETTTIIHSNDIVLDIRTEYEQKNSPLDLVNNNVIVQKIPFYYLKDQFPNLDQNKVYLLYCTHGILSQLQAINLYQRGFNNIKVYRPI